MYIFLFSPHFLPDLINYKVIFVHCYLEIPGGWQFVRWLLPNRNDWFNRRWRYSRLVSDQVSWCFTVLETCAMWYLRLMPVVPETCASGTWDSGQWNLRLVPEWYHLRFRPVEPETHASGTWDSCHWNLRLMPVVPETCAMWCLRFSCQWYLRLVPVFEILASETWDSCHWYLRLVPCGVWDLFTQCVNCNLSCTMLQKWFIPVVHEALHLNRHSKSLDLYLVMDVVVLVSSRPSCRLDLER